MKEVFVNELYKNNYLNNDKSKALNILLHFYYKNIEIGLFYAV